MAGNKVNTKTKGKPSKSVTQSNGDVEDLDFALLRKPIHTSITGFAQARKIFDFATEELKDLLSNECDLLYECKVCRNIFRSLANFISHKRVYCKEKFSTSVHSHFIKSSSTVEEIIKIKSAETEYQESLVKNGTESKDEDDDRVPLTKDLTAIVEKITNTKGVEINSDPQLVLQKIPNSTVAMFQNMDSNEEKKDLMRAQVQEIESILSRDKAVLQSDGKFTVESSEQARDADGVIQISDDEDHGADSLMCKICDLQFSTQKTLKFHMKYKHVESRLVYPCPDCLEIFSTSWSVYRHLFKVHRKTAAQIRRLRESIQAKAFRMNNPPAYYEKRKNNMKPVAAQKITEEERLDQENQAWMDNMEGDSEVPRCGGCGRTFERRAALQAHTHTCPPRSRALQRRDNKRIEIQIRKDYNKGPAATPGLAMLKVADTNDTKLINEDSQTSIKTQDSDKNYDSEEKEDDVPIEVDDEKSSDSVDSPEKLADTKPLPEIKPATCLPFAIQTEKSNLAAFRQRIQSDIDFHKLLCKRCDTKLNTVLQLYEHMAEHFKWIRYACKLCNYKHYNFEKLPEHVKVVHKLKGDTDFYFSTVKAVDGTEAMILSKCMVEEGPADNTNETSPESRRASRCSSDSSRLSDDSSSSATLKETGTRKRKMQHNKNMAKRKRESTTNDTSEDQKDGDISMDKVMKVILGDSESSKTFEENSSDIDDADEKNTKRNVVDVVPSVASRRPVRKKTKRKNEDFEYDLSNLLKMEAQGYRDSQSTVTTTKTTQSKKKAQNDHQNNYMNELNKDCFGALATLSQKAVVKGNALMKITNFPENVIPVSRFAGPCDNTVVPSRTSGLSVLSIQRERQLNTFVRPTIPRLLARGDKASPKKDITDDPKSSSTLKPNSKPELKTGKELKIKEEILDVENDVDKKDEILDTNADKSENKDNDKAVEETVNAVETAEKIKDSDITNSSNEQPEDKIQPKSANDSEKTAIEKVQSTNSNDSPSQMVPIKFRRQSIDLMKNPIINKNIKAFSKAGMKTKILVIKPINRNDGIRPVNTPLKFQTIKLKDPNKGSSSSEDKDQIVVVKVPKVDIAINRPVNDTNTETPSQTVNSNNTVDEKLESKCEELEKTVKDTQNVTTVTEKELETEVIPEDVETKCDSNDENKTEPVPASTNSAIENVSDNNKETIIESDTNKSENVL